MMTVNSAGFALIKAYEGFRAKAYLCPADVWTIGYGHTSMAGPPDVKRGMQITRDEAERILIEDTGKFAARVQALIRGSLNDNQFSALVSFAYNVGVGAFRDSSVLRAVNAGDLAAVPRRLALWVKAGGRTLPGLVKRRASEGQLFMRPPGSVALFDDVMALPTDHERQEMDNARGLIDAMEGKAMARSSTVWSAITGLFSTIGMAVGAVKDEVQKYVWEAWSWFSVVPEGWWPYVQAGFVATGVASAAYVIWERYKKARDDGL
jgi:GH24 family phage-related lysozyme (muramidase)